MTLLSRPIFPGCGWLWRYVSPAVLLGLLMFILIYLVKGPLVYMAWDSSTVSAPSQILGLLPVRSELRTWALAPIIENSPASPPRSPTHLFLFWGFCCLNLCFCVSP